LTAARQDAYRSGKQKKAIVPVVMGTIAFFVLIVER
jgi:hypothetical protein